MAVKKYGRRRGYREESREEAPDSARVWRMSRLTRDGTAKPLSRSEILRRERDKDFFPCSAADHDKNWQAYPVDLYSVIMP